MNLQVVADMIDTISPLITMGFGIFGATRDTKPVNGKLTRNGRIALWGIILSATFTLVVKSANLYYKDKQKDEQKKKDDAAALEKLKQEQANIQFQKGVADSFTTSIRNLQSINDLAKSNIDETKKVNVSTRENLNETKAVNDVAKGVLQQTDRIVNPLFPLRIAVIYEVPAYSNYRFWDFLNTAIKSKENDDAQLTNVLIKEYLQKYPDGRRELINLLSVNINLDIYKEHINSHNHIGFAHPSDDDSATVLDNEHIVKLDFENRLLTVVAMFHEKRPSLTTGYSFRGEGDLFNSYYEIGVHGYVPTQLIALYIDKGWWNNGLYSKVFYDCEDKKHIPYRNEYRGFIKGKTELQSCGMLWVDVMLDPTDQ